MPVVDLVFRLHGEKILVDHGYQLYSAISRLIPELHSDDDIGLHPISGPLAGNRCQLITDRSVLGIRLPSERMDRSERWPCPEFRSRPKDTIG